MELPHLPERIPVSLRRLFPHASYVGCAEIAVSHATERSRDCVRGSLFAALPGLRTHGRQFAQEAEQRGAAAILTDRPLANVRVPQCIVPEPRAAFSQLCQSLYCWPTRRLGVVGVTGTNGKTSTTWLVRSIMEAARRPCGLIGTIEYSDSIQRIPASLTTPDSLTLAEWLAATAQRRASCAAIELSSHALEQGRASGTLLDVAIVTGITHDHLDYHTSPEAYRNAKRRIFTHLKRRGLVLLCADDPVCMSLLGDVPDHVVVRTFGLSTEADISATGIQSSITGTRFRLQNGISETSIETSLIGSHNILNCLAAAGAATHLGVSNEEIVTGIRELHGIPGRLERVDAGQSFSVFVDYAHTGDALSRAIESVRRVTTGRVLCVFGAGGDRDPSKRPGMGRAALGADICVLTSDNPRSESPDAIIAQIAQGLSASDSGLENQCHSIIEPDRRRAIESAFQLARPGDAVLVAGKGHESVQIIGETRHRFHDVEVCRELLALQTSLVPHDRQRQTA